MHLTPNEEPVDPLPHRHPPFRVPLRVLVLVITMAGMGMFTWYRTRGDLLLSLIVAVMTAAIIEVRVSDPQAR